MNMDNTYLDAVRCLENEGNPSPERCINVLLLRYPDNSSKLFRLVSRSFYNHASIGVSESDGTFYSYVKTGFRKEYPKLHPTFKEQEVPCILFQIRVSEEMYQVTKAALAEHEREAYQYKYNTIGLLFCLLRFGSKRKHRYFCSQFVSEMLEQMRAVSLRKHSSLYLPDDFMSLDGLNLRFSGLLSQLISQEQTA